MKPPSTRIRRRSQACLRVVSVLQHIERTNPWSAWKTLPSTLWPTSVSWSWPMVFEFLEDERSRGIPVSNQLLLVCNIMFLFQHLPEEGAYLRDKMSDPPLPSSTLLTGAKVAKRGHICRTLWYIQTNTCWKHKATLGPANHTLCAQLAGKNIRGFLLFHSQA